MADKKYIGEPGKQDDPCWKGYEMVGMKKKGGRKVPNCVPEAREIVEKAKAMVKKDALTGAKIDKNRFILPEESSDTFPWHEDPKNPTRKVGARKDEFGNPVKNVARYLAKKAMKANEEVEDLDETAKIVAHLQKRYGDNIRKSHVRSAANDFGVDASKLARAVRTKLGKNMLDEEQIDELSVNKLDQYRSKARTDIIDADANDDNRMYNKRTKGYVAASKQVQKKLAKEEIDPDLEAELKATRVTKKSLADTKKKYGIKEEETNEDIVRTGTLAQRSQAYRADKAKKAGAKLKIDPDTGTPDHFTAAQRRKKGLDEGVTNPEIKKAYADLIKTPGGSSERKSAIRRYKSLRQNAVKEEAEIEEAHGMWKVDFPKQHAGKAVAAGSVHVKAQNTAHAHKVAAKRVGVDRKMFKSKVTKSSVLPEEVEQVDEYNNYRKSGKDPYAQRKQYIAMDRAEKKGVMPGSATSTADAIAAFKAKGGKTTKLDTKGNMKEGMMPTSDEPTAANKKTADKVRAMMAKEKKSVKEEVEGKVYSVHVKGDSKDHNSPEFKKHLKGWGGELHYASDKGAAYKFKKEYQATGFHHGVKSGFKSLDSEHDGQVKEELGKDNEWGRPELRKKFAAMTPGQESMAADKIPTFDPRYDDVPTEYCGGIKEALLNEISAKGAVARADFRAKVQKVLADPAAISKAKKTLAKKKAAEKAAEPVHLVMQLRKASSIGSKVQFRNGESHHVAPNHVEKFNDKYHSLKSSIEKESLINRAHKSHADFFKAIAEETLDITQQGGGPQYDTHRGNGGHIGDVDLCCDEIRFQDFDEKDMEELEAEVDNMTWEDIVDEYDDEELEYVDGEEEIEEGVTPQGRLKKKFSAMRNKTRRNMARNLALKRVSTPDRIKARSISTARRMVYQRFLRGRDKSSMSAAEKTRIEAQVKRLAPSVARLSVRIVGQVRKLEQSRIKNRTTGRKK